MIDKPDIVPLGKSIVGPDSRLGTRACCESSGRIWRVSISSDRDTWRGLKGSISLAGKGMYSTRPLRTCTGQERFGPVKGVGGWVKLREAVKGEHGIMYRMRTKALSPSACRVVTNRPRYSFTVSYRNRGHRYKHSRRRINK